MARADHGMGTGTPAPPQGIPSGSGDEDVVSQPEQRIVAGPDGPERAPSGYGAGFRDPQARTPASPVAGAYGAGHTPTAQTAEADRKKEDGAARGEPSTPEQVRASTRAEQRAEADLKEARTADPES